MNPYYRITLLVVCSICLCIGCQEKQETPKENSTNIRVTGLKTDTMNYFAAEQEKQNWCWAASIQMALSAKGIDISQEAIVQKTFGTTNDHPGSWLDIFNNLNGWMKTRSGTKVHLKTTVVEGAPSLETLKTELDSGTPVIIGYNTTGSSVGHAVVITAVIYEMTTRGPEIIRVIVRDPGPSHSDKRGKREMEASEFNQVEAHFVITPFE